MLTYKVLVIKHADNRYTARPLTWPVVQAEGTSEQEALDNLRTRLIVLHAQSRIVDLDVPVPEQPVYDPWLALIGSAKDDPDWEKYQEAIAEFRREANTVDIPE